MRQRLAAPLFRQRHCVPSGCGPAAIGLLPAGRHRDVAVLERRAELVAHGIERRDDLGREFSGFLQHRIDIVGGERAALRQKLREARAMLEREGDIGDRGAVGHAIILLAILPQCRFKLNRRCGGCFPSPTKQRSRRLRRAVGRAPEREGTHRRRGGQRGRPHTFH